MDYEKLGLMVGLELHRQIESHKLFCNCPSEFREDDPDLIIKRKLRAVESESQEKDLVAEFETAKRKYGVYEYYSDVDCLVELDEEPPHEMNKDALNICLQVCKLLNLEVADEINVMRKQVIDYSNVSGFQRTALIARNGLVEINGKKITIPTICLEEDAARRIDSKKSYIVYRLDRLGIPLIELVTGPDIKTPEQAKEVAEYLGMVMKSTGKMKSGIGTIRQDVNVSIKGGARVEIKGVQDLKGIPKVIENEVKRQLEIIKKGKKVTSEVRRALKDNTSEYMRPMPGSARMYPETDVPKIKLTKKELNSIELPELITEVVLNIEKKYKLTPKLSRELIKLDKLDLFKRGIKDFKKIKPISVAQNIIEVPKEIKKRYSIEVKNSDIEYVLNLLNEGNINQDVFIDVLVKKAKNEKINLDSYKKVDSSEVEKEIKKIIDKNKGASFNALMGEVMKHFKGKVDGKTASSILKKYIK